MTILHGHHHGFTVSDLDRSLAYYRDALGLELVHVSERRNLPAYDQILGYNNAVIHVALLRHPVNDFLLELIVYENPPGKTRSLENTFAGASHVAFAVDDVDAVYSRLQTSGYGAINPPVDIKREGVVAARALYALDPDGITVEFFQEYADVVEN